VLIEHFFRSICYCHNCAAIYQLYPVYTWNKYLYKLFVHVLYTQFLESHWYECFHFFLAAHNLWLYCFEKNNLLNNICYKSSKTYGLYSSFNLLISFYLSKNLLISLGFLFFLFFPTFKTNSICSWSPYFDLNMIFFF